MDKAPEAPRVKTRADEIDMMNEKVTSLPQQPLPHDERIPDGGVAGAAGRVVSMRASCLHCLPIREVVGAVNEPEGGHSLRVLDNSKKACDPPEDGGDGHNNLWSDWPWCSRFHIYGGEGTRH